MYNILGFIFLILTGTKVYYYDNCFIGE